MHCMISGESHIEYDQYIILPLSCSFKVATVHQTIIMFYSPNIYSKLLYVCMYMYEVTMLYLLSE